MVMEIDERMGGLGAPVIKVASEANGQNTWHDVGGVMLEYIGKVEGTVGSRHELVESDACLLVQSDGAHCPESGPDGVVLQIHRNQLGAHTQISSSPDHRYCCYIFLVRP
jgi:hypothetical protein